jgi:hypothetical protein
MARYEIGVAKTTGAAAGLLCQLRAGSARDAEVVEIGIFATTAVAGEVALIRPSVVGATFTSSAVGAALDNIAGAAASVVDTAAGTAPTIGTNYMRRIQFPATIGAGVIWSWPRENCPVIPVSGSLALWQLSAAAVGYDVYWAWYE